MQRINDFYTILNDFLSRQENIQQCIIKDYVFDKDKGIATCTALVPKTDIEQQELRNIVCYIGSAVDITFSDYMQGILLNIQNRYVSAQDISTQTPAVKYDYFNSTTDNLIAIIIPHSETIDNILTASITAKESFKAQAPKCYIGSEEVNVLDELSEYLALLKDFFDKFAQNAPTLSAQPGSGSAVMQQASTEMSAKTDEIYKKISEITKPDNS